MCQITSKVSKNDVEAFNGFCVFVRWLWRHHQILFEGTDLKCELLQSISPKFFHDICEMLLQNLILRICQITDPEGSTERKNLTVKFLVNNSDFSTALAEADELKRLSDSMHVFRKKIEPARNKYIGHLDRKSVHLDQPLGAAEPSEWNQFWLDLQDFLRVMQRRYVDPNSHFELNDIDNLSDADNLVKALKESTYFCALLDDKETTKKSADVAFKS